MIKNHQIYSCSHRHFYMHVQCLVLFIERLSVVFSLSLFVERKQKKKKKKLRCKESTEDEEEIEREKEEDKKKKKKRKAIQDIHTSYRCTERNSISPPQTKKRKSFSLSLSLVKLTTRIAGVAVEAREQESIDIRAKIRAHMERHKQREREKSMDNRGIVQTYRQIYRQIEI